MIDVKKAVMSATRFVQDLYAEPLNDLLLEEVELSPDEQFWLVTLSFTQTDTNVFKAIGDSSTPTPVYKLVKVDAHTGVALSMKIRQTETAL